MSAGRRRALHAAGAAWLASHGAGALAASAVAAVRAPDAGAAARSQHFPFGPVVPPRPMVAWTVVTQSGVHTELTKLLQGRVTALHLMFTGCSATCPIQGALFAQAQRDLQLPPASPAAQFVSVSIDPLSDTPAALAGWLRQFSAKPGWTAVAPRPGDLAALVALLAEGGESRPAEVTDPHPGQVYLFDPRGNLVYRLASMPSPKAIVAAIVAVAKRG